MSMKFRNAQPARGFRSGRILVIALLAITACAATARAQVDFSGEWAPVRAMDSTENPWVGDFVGLPLNPDGLARAEGWDASILSLPEYQCRPHGWAYIYRGPTQLRISKEVDPFSREVIAYQPEWHQSTNMPVYLDGRDSPPINIIHDPVYLSEPLVRSAEYRLTVNSQVPAHPCTSAFEGLEKGQVPHYLPGENPFLKDIRQRYGLPDGPTGGPATMYPEYRKTLQPDNWSKGDRKAVSGSGF
jgi:hypothetical protein